METLPWLVGMWVLMPQALTLPELGGSLVIDTSLMCIYMYIQLKQRNQARKRMLVLHANCFLEYAASSAVCNPI